MIGAQTRRITKKLGTGQETLPNGVGEQARNTEMLQGMHVPAAQERQMRRSRVHDYQMRAIQGCIEDVTARDRSHWKSKSPGGGARWNVAGVKKCNHSQAARQGGQQWFGIRWAWVHSKKWHAGEREESSPTSTIGLP